MSFVYYFRDGWRTRKNALQNSLIIMCTLSLFIYAEAESFLEMIVGFTFLFFCLSINLIIHYFLFKDNWLNIPKYISIHGDKWTESDIKKSTDWAITQTWHKTRWSSVSNEDNYDHCEVCRWVLLDSEDLEKGMGYRNDGGCWLCTVCYEKFLNKKP